MVFQNNLDSVVEWSPVFTLGCRYDGPANAMSHCLYKLAMNPGVQARLIQEVDSLGPGARPTYKDLARLPYAEATFQVRAEA